MDEPLIAQVTGNTGRSTEVGKRAAGHELTAHVTERINVEVIGLYVTTITKIGKAFRDIFIKALERMPGRNIRIILSQYFTQGHGQLRIRRGVLPETENKGDKRFLFFRCQRRTAKFERIDAERLVLVILYMDGNFRIKIAQLLEAVTELHTDYGKVLIQQLMDDVVHKERLTGTRRGNDNGITGFNPPVMGVPYIFSKRDLSQTIIEINAFRIV